MRPAALTLFIFCTIPGLLAQQLINARAGLITFAEGPVLLEKKPFQFNEGRLEALESGQTLHTVAGKAEVQLGPGSSLWMGVSSSIRMIRSLLEDTVIQINSGEIFIEIAQKYKNNLLSVHLGDAVVELREQGQYSFKTDPNRIYVHKGKAKLSTQHKNGTVTKGKFAYLESPYSIHKFKEIGYDPLMRWAGSRSRVLFQPIMMARRMEAARQQMENLRFRQEMQEMQRLQQLEQQRIQQELQMEQMRQQRVFQ